MEKINRRSFLKICGVSAIAPAALLAGEKKPMHPVDVLVDLGFPKGLYLDQMRKYCDEPVRPDIYDGQQWHEVCAIQTDKHYMIYKNGKLFVESGHQVYIDGWKVNDFVPEDDFQVEGFIQVEIDGLLTDRFRFRKINNQ